MGAKQIARGGEKSMGLFKIKRSKETLLRKIPFLFDEVQSIIENF
jgi:hypothetical protein